MKIVILLLIMCSLASAELRSTLINIEEQITITNVLNRANNSWNRTEYSYLPNRLLADINSNQWVSIYASQGTFNIFDYELVSGGYQTEWNNFDLKQDYIFEDPNGVIWDAVYIDGDTKYFGPGKLYVRFGYRGAHRITNQGYLETATDPITQGKLSVEQRITVNVVGENSSVDETNFSIALDDDGDRVAMGYKEAGSNAVIRVYEFDGSSWNKLGDDVE